MKIQPFQSMCIYSMEAVYVCKVTNHVSLYQEALPSSVVFLLFIGLVFFSLI